MSDVWGLERVARGGELLTRRMWAITEAVEGELGVRLEVAQGSWSDGSLSGSTHKGSGAVDYRVGNLTRSQREAAVVELRRLGVCAWLRDEQHGGFAPHIHGIDRYDPGLSSGARWQVQQYDRGRDGLSASGPDYHPRPAQHAPSEDELMALNDDDVARIAQAVWSVKRDTYPERSTYGLLVDVRRATYEAGPTPAPGPAEPGAAVVDLDALADKVVARLASRLQS